MKLGIKLQLYFLGLVLISGLILGFTSLRNLNGIGQVLKQFVGEGVPSIKASSDVEQYLVTSQLEGKNFLLDINDARADEEVDKVSANASLAQAHKALVELENLATTTNDTDLTSSISDVKKLTSQYEKDLNEVIDAMGKNHKVAESLEVKGGEVAALIGNYLTSVAGKSDDESLATVPILIDILNTSMNARLSMNEYILTKDEQKLTDLQNGVKKLRERFLDLNEVVTAAEGQGMLIDVRIINEEFYQLSQDWIKNENNLKPLITRMNETGQIIRQKIVAMQNVIWEDIDNSQAAADKIMNQANLFTAGSIVLTLFIGIILGLLLSRSITRPLQLVTRASTQIADQDLQNLADQMKMMARGDLTRSLHISTEPISVSAKDEIGDLGRAFNSMIANLQETGQSFQEMNDNLNTVIGMVAENASNLNSASGQLSSAANQSSLAINQIASTIQQIAKGSAQETESISLTSMSVEQMSRAIEGIAKGAQEQSISVTQAADLSSQISAAIQLVSENARVSSSDASNAALIARKGVDTVAETIKGMQTIKSKVELSTEKVREMGSRSDQIGIIVETIDDIASQTNLLALNAAIEAARAGEHGKGFAVVADEVRKLAERSSSATKEIGELVKGIQKTVNEAVYAMAESSAEVERGVITAGQSDKALDEIMAAIEGVNRQVGEIATAAREINTSAEELLTSMDTVSAVVEENTASAEAMFSDSGEVTRAIENIASVSEENSASVEEVSASSEEMTAQVDDVTDSAASLAGMAAELNSIVSQFQLAQVDVTPIELTLAAEKLEAPV
jgi:methyl-accepting chemotaxis protein